MPQQKRQKRSRSGPIVGDTTGARYRLMQLVQQQIIGDSEHRHRHAGEQADIDGPTDPADNSRHSILSPCRICSGQMQKTDASLLKMQAIDVLRRSEIPGKLRNFVLRLRAAD